MEELILQGPTSDNHGGISGGGTNGAGTICGRKEGGVIHGGSAGGVYNLV